MPKFRPGCFTIEVIFAENQQIGQKTKSLMGLVVWGRGTLKIIEAMNKAKLPPPEMLETSGGFEVILRKSVITGDTPAITGMNEKETLIIKLLERNVEMKASTISQAVSLSPSWTRDLLKKMSEKKYT